MDNLQHSIRYTNELWDHYGIHVADEPEAGDLIFFSKKGGFPSHVGFVNNKDTFIHAPGKTGAVVCIEPIRQEPINLSDQTGRVLYRKNPIGFKAPTQPYIEQCDRYHQKLA